MCQIENENIDLSCSKKTLGSKVCSFKTSNFQPAPLIKKGLLELMEGVNDNASAFMHLDIKTNK